MVYNAFLILIILILSIIMVGCAYLLLRMGIRDKERGLVIVATCCLILSLPIFSQCIYLLVTTINSYEEKQVVSIQIEDKKRESHYNNATKTIDITYKFRFNDNQDSVKVNKGMFNYYEIGDEIEVYKVFVYVKSGTKSGELRRIEYRMIN